MKSDFKDRFLLTWLLLMVFTIGCEDSAVAPVAKLSVNSHFGYTGRALTFSASTSEDADNDPLGLRCRWDFESDGIWDTPYSLNHEVNHAFSTTGTFTVTLEVMDQTDLTDLTTDTILLYGRLPDSSMIDPRDNQSYHIVKINHLWIMAENLRYGKMILSSQKQTDNEVVEYYAYDNDPANISQYGGLYGWYEAMNYENHTRNQGICPPGWRIPDKTDIRKIAIPASHYFNVDYYRSGGLSGLNIDFPGSYWDCPVGIRYNPPGPTWIHPGDIAQYWSTYYHYQDFRDYGFGEEFQLGRFSFYRVTIRLQIYKGDGIDLSPVFDIRDLPDGFYDIPYISVRCVSDQF
jgi:hypothetical protein